jgi:hypothetical protein
MGRSHVGQANAHLIIDCGVLMEWLITEYETSTHRKWPGRFQRHVLDSPERREAFQQLLAEYPGRIVLSAYTIAEVQRHQRDAEKASRQHPGIHDLCERFWGRAISSLKDRKVSERHEPLLDLKADLVCAFGPADAGLIGVSRTLTKEGKIPLIAAHDRSLVMKCRELDVSAEQLDDLLDERIESGSL